MQINLHMEIRVILGTVLFNYDLLDVFFFFPDETRILAKEKKRVLKPKNNFKSNTHNFTATASSTFRSCGRK